MFVLVNDMTYDKLGLVEELPHPWPEPLGMLRRSLATPGFASYFLRRMKYRQGVLADQILKADPAISRMVDLMLHSKVERIGEQGVAVTSRNLDI